MPKDKRAPRPEEIYVLIAVDIPDMGTVATREEWGSAAYSTE
jgi:hypothetical protein